MALLLLVVLSLIAAALGRKVLRLLGVDPQEPAEELVISLGLGYGVFAYFILALGLAGVVYRSVIVAGVAVIAVGTWREIPALQIWHTHRGRGSWSGTARTVGLFILMAAAANLVGALAPATVPDALSYHLNAPKLWLQQHRLTPITSSWVTFQPLNVEMLYLLGMALSSDTLASLINWAFGLLAAAGTFLLTRRHLPRASPWIAAGVYYVSALIAMESIGVFVELGLAVFTVLAVHCLLVSTSEQRSAEERGRWLVLSGVFAGMAGGTKYLGLFIPAVLLVIVLVSRPFPVGRRSILLAFGVPAVVLVLPWLIRNFVSTGDPLYPFLTAWRTDGRLRASLVELSRLHGYGKNLLDLVVLPFRLTFAGGAFDRGELISPLYLSLLPLSLLQIYRRRAVRILWLFVIGYGLLWFATSQQARFLLPAMSAAAVLSAAAVRTVEERGATARTVLRGFLILALAAGAGGAFAYAADTAPVVFGVEAREHYLARTAEFYEDMAWMNKHLPPDARVLVTVSGTYYLDRPYVILTRSRDLRALPLLLARERITHVYCTGAACAGLRAIVPQAPVLREGDAFKRLSRRAMTRPVVHTMVLQVPPASGW